MDWGEGKKKKKNKNKNKNKNKKKKHDEGRTVHAINREQRYHFGPLLFPLKHRVTHTTAFPHPPPEPYTCSWLAALFSFHRVTRFVMASLVPEAKGKSLAGRCRQ